MNNIIRRRIQRRRRLLGLGMIAFAVVIATASLITLIHASSSANTPSHLTSNVSGNQNITNNTTATVSGTATAKPTRSITATPKPIPPTATSAPTAPTATPIPVTGTGGTGNTTGGNGGTSSSPWQLIFNDDFNGTQLNPTWGVYGGPHGGGDSYYSPSEVSVSNGMLHLQMERKTSNGLPYTTGGIAAFRLAQIYGKYVFRVRLPYGKGVGPYAILWPNSPGYVAQTDIFESPPATKNELFFTNHGINGGATTQLTATGSFASDFHILTCEWSPNKLQFYVDGVSQGVLTQSIPNQAMWFGIAVASGDAFTGNPDATTPFPVSLDVDWVQIYKYTG